MKVWKSRKLAPPLGPEIMRTETVHGSSARCGQTVNRQSERICKAKSPSFYNLNNFFWTRKCNALNNPRSNSLNNLKLQCNALNNPF